MFQNSINDNKTETTNYCVMEDRDGNPHLARCSARLGYPTVAAATEAALNDIKGKERLDLDEIRGCVNDIEKAKEQRGRAYLYYELNELMDEIEKGRKEQEKVRGLSLEDGSR